MTDSGETITLTTETRSARRARIFLLVILGGMAALLVAMFVLNAPAGEDRETMISSIVFDLIALGLLGMMARMILRARGTWHITDEGIEHTPCSGQPTYLAWKDVERVHWTVAPTFVGDRLKVRIEAGFIDEAERKRARQRIRRILEPDFDLPPERMSRSERVREFFAGTRRVLLALAAPVAVMLILYHYREEEWARRFLAIFLMLMMAFFVICGSYLAWKKNRELWIERRESDAGPP